MMIDRTNRQNALPITFGFSLPAGLPARRTGETVDAAALICTPFGGAIGAMQSFGDQGRELNKRLAADLNLPKMLLPGEPLMMFLPVFVAIVNAGSIERVMTRPYPDRAGLWRVGGTAGLWHYRIINKRKK